MPPSHSSQRAPNAPHAATSQDGGFVLDSWQRVQPQETYTTCMASVVGGAVEVLQSRCLAFVGLPDSI
jgi:hypothetical protein